MDSGDGFADAAMGVASGRTAMRPSAMAGIFDSSGSACSKGMIVSSPYVMNRSTSSNFCASSALTVR